MSTLDAEVAIVGAGPVGLTLAIDLAARGRSVVMLEARARGEPPNVKCNHVAARTMEQFRRLGLAADVRSAGLPADYPNDVAFRTSVTGIELSRIHIPPRATRYTDRSGPDGWWPTPEPPHRINQIYLEPILFAHAAARAGVTIKNRCEATGFVQDDDGVTISARDHATGADATVRAKYLVGCDGGRSIVRKAIGAVFAGTPVIQRVQSTYIRAPGLLALVRGERAWSCYASNPRRSGVCFAIDGRETWLVHNHLMPDEEDFETVDRDTCIRNILGVDAGFRYETISKEDWIGRRLVADGRSLYDAFGSDYTLLRFDPAGEVAALLDAARERAVPVKLLDVRRADAPAEYRHVLVLCRADQHIAWRGDVVPADPAALIEQLRGAIPRSPP